MTADAAAAIRSQPVVRAAATRDAAAGDESSAIARGRTRRSSGGASPRWRSRGAAGRGAVVAARAARRGAAAARARARSAAVRARRGHAALSSAASSSSGRSTTLEPLSFVFARLLEPLSTALERADRGAAAIRLDLRLTDRDDAHARAAAAGADARPQGAPHAAPARSRIASSRPRPSTSCRSSSIPRPRASRSSRCSSARCRRRKRCRRSRRACRRWWGRRGLASAVLLDSHRPGAFEMARFAPECEVLSDAPAALPVDRHRCCGERCEGRLRCSVLRRQRIPPAIRVSVEHGRPVYVAAAKRGHAAGGRRAGRGTVANVGRVVVGTPDRATGLKAGSGAIVTWDRRRAVIRRSDGAVLPDLSRTRTTRSGGFSAPRHSYD